MASSRALLKKRKKKRKRKIILALLCVLFLSSIAFASYEYMAGKRDALGIISGSSEDYEDTKENESQYKEEFKGVDNNDGKTNVLLLGVDQRDQETSRSDTIMIGQYAPEENSAKLVSLMRDTYVDIPGHGYNKLNAAFAIGGPELMRKTIKENFGIEVEYYSIVDFDGFEHIVNTVKPEGIEIDVEESMQHKDNAGTINLEPGTQKLNGDELLGYARYRGGASSDFGRVERQQKVIKRLKEELVSVSGALKAPRLLGTVQPYFDTNIGKGKMLGLMKDFLFNPVDEIETLRIPDEGTYWSERKEYPIGLVLAHDEAANREALQEFLNEE
ncbi:LCP family protein [Thalassobacillus sp. CUG 92003]|uniref:LCP family protein n=1 Tax=Thalassobacillus sp. CUG 92003 TaxID=2736641 RepID=UPI0015E78C34|nr:LCP family protein [Thalassobacillus sp. CUG 92003]